MNKRKFLLATTLVGAISAGALLPGGYAFAKGYESCSRHSKHSGQFSERHMQKKLSRLTQKLGLSAQQIEQIKAAMTNKHEAMKVFREQMKTVRENMRNLDPASNNFDDQLASLADQKAELVRQIMITRGKHRQMMAQILSPEQRETMKQMRATRKARHNRCNRPNRHQH